MASGLEIHRPRPRYGLFLLDESLLVQPQARGGSHEYRRWQRLALQTEQQWPWQALYLAAEFVIRLASLARPAGWGEDNPWRQSAVGLSCLDLRERACENSCLLDATVLVAG